MPLGSSSQGDKTGVKPQGKKSTNTVQTLLSARKDLDSQKNPKLPKRTHSELSSESDNSMELSGLTNLQKDLDEIKLNLKGVTKKDDFDMFTKDLVRTHDLEIVVTTIVNKLFQRFESTMDKKINCRVAQVEKEMQEKIEALSVENEDLRKQINQVRETVINEKKILKDTVNYTQEAIVSANYNEQYSRKNNIKVMNFPRHEKQDLRSDFIQKVRRDLNVQLQERDVVAIHRLPSNQPGPNPVIVRLFNSDVKRSIMRVRKDLKDKVRFSDDVTRRNMQLITKLRDMECFESVWYYNCGVFGRTEDGLQLKYRLFDDVRRRLQERK
ncbi:unnamed protein product [Mytilus edulis]|uniref:Uncharacterized protein n=2 Tax=Mytilus TaxID=6548 RepID=A0A8B6DZR1_MYTGA|nr:unnamed protein product [Mytilus edulis]VDI27011.1 Hypothetical predicted protein [Mytilus galloprovincialis]